MSAKEKIRVLIADDSFFIRTYLSELLGNDEEIAVIGTASSGREAVLLAKKLHPDVITMDYHMPEGNGLEAAAAIMLGEPPLPAIIMLSAFEGEEGKKVWRTLEESGAHVIVKPSGEISLDIEKIADEIVRTVKEAGRAEVAMRRRLAERGHARHARFAAEPSGASATVVIGASTGGPPLVEHLLTALSARDGIAVIVAQHMSEYFTALFAERLDRVTDFDVRQMKNGDYLTSGTALIVPGGFHITVSPLDAAVVPRCELLLSPERAAREETTIDHAMRAAVRCFGARTIGILLSGMGHDGTEGLAAIKRAGGRTIVQDPKTAPVSAMPASAVAAGVADAVLPIEDIPARVRELLLA